MASYSRRKLLGERRIADFHCWNRCVRRAFLCGQDPLSRKDLSHRRDWIVNREQQLAALFAIEVTFHTEMSNHLHLVLRTRPDIAKRWSAEEVARRWLTITRLAKCLSDDLPQPTPEQVQELVQNKKRIQKLRRRLSKISWFMGILCENIARRANAEDDCTGRFFESRFKCRECVDDAGKLLCGLYVDLNPLKAGEATSPETARYSSAYQRILARQQAPDAPDRADGWLAELSLRDGPEEDLTKVYSSRTGRRASDLGVLSISWDNYYQLLAWTWQEMRSGHRSTVPQDLQAVLDQLQVQADTWVDSIRDYEETFGHAVGGAAGLAAVAERMQRRCLRGAPACRRVFA